MTGADDAVTIVISLQPVTWILFGVLLGINIEVDGNKI